MTVEKAEKAGGGGHESIHMTGEKAENVVKKMTVEKAEKAGSGGQESIQMTGEKSGKAGAAGQESNNGSGGHPANSKSRSSRWDNDHPVSKSRSNRKDKQQPISKQGTQPGQVASPPDIDAVTAGAKNSAAGSPMEPNTTTAVESHKSIPKPLNPTEKGHSRDSVDAGHAKKPRLENAVAKPVEFGFEILDRRSITMMDGTVRTYYSLPRSEQREPFPSDHAAASSLENARFGSRELNPGHHSQGNQDDLPLENPQPHGGPFDARKAELQRFYAANTMAPPHQDDLPPETPHPHGGPFDARKAELQRFYAANPMEPPPQSFGLGYENYGSSVYGNFRKVPGDECSDPRDGYPENGADKGPSSIEIPRERNYVPAGVSGSDGSAMEGHPDRNLVPEGFGPAEGLRAPRSSQGFHVSTRPVSARMSPREPPTKGSAILHGVNYASGGSGILNSTGSIFVGRLSLEVQVNNFAETRKELTSMLGANATKELLGKSVFSITMGANDFINNYLVPIASTIQRVLVTPDSFIDQVMTTYRAQLMRLYEMDARKIIVANVGPIGCIPYERTLNRVDENQCAALPNELALMFNKRLRPLIMDLNANCKGATFVYANTYDMVEDLIKNYAKYGFEASNIACCGRGGEFRGVIPCGPTSTECNDHEKYVFWDPYHPSEAANLVVAKRLIDGGPNDVFPINVRKLIQI